MALADLGRPRNSSFEPPPDRSRTSARSAANYNQLERVVSGIDNTQSVLSRSIRRQSYERRLKVPRWSRSTTQQKTDALVALNRSSYDSSRNLFIAVAAGTVALALLLGFVLPGR